MDVELTWVDCGERLRALRCAAGISQRELAQASGMSQGQISRIETGVHEPAVLAAVRLCGTLGISVEALTSPAQGRWQEAMRAADARRMALGGDPDGRPVVVRRDRALFGGPHSTFTGQRSLDIAAVEITRRVTAGLRCVVLARDPRWLEPRRLAAWGARPGAGTPVQDLVTVVALSAAAAGGEEAAAALQAAYAVGDGLVVVDGQALVEHPQLARLVDATLRHGRRVGCAINIVSGDAPPAWALANTAQALRADTDAVRLTVATRRAR